MSPTARGGTMLAAGLLVVLVAVVYGRTLHVPLLLDDASAITTNDSIRNLHAWRQVLFAPDGSTTAARPLLNLSFALNWAAGADRVAGYHLFNTVVHAIAVLLVFAVTRRLLRRDLAAAATPVAWLAAALWAVHPLLTESVTYISERAESLMAACYLGVLYAFVRGVESRRPGGWQVLAVGVCAAGMAVKEVMVTAPLVVLLCDRAWFSESFASALRRRLRLYAGLALTWIELAALMAAAHVDTWTVKGGATVPWWMYADNETWVIVRYLGLAFWPHPLVFDYGTAAYASSMWHLVPSMLVVGAIVAGALLLWIRRPRLGFAAVTFFILLAPTTSVVPIAVQPMAENRMYLPLALVTTLAAVGLHRVLGRTALRVGVVLVAALGLAAFARNEVYQTDVAIWSDTVAKEPANDRAHNNLGVALANRPDRSAAAKAEYETALRLNPLNADAHYNLANLLKKDPSQAEAAIAEYHISLRLRPDYPPAHNNLGLLLGTLPGRLGEAVAEFERAVEGRPADPEMRSNLATALRQIPGRAAEALAQSRAAAALAPNNPYLHYNLGNALLAEPGGEIEAISEYRRALALRPDYTDARNNLAAALLQAGRRDEARAELEAALRLHPGDARLRENVERLRGP